MGIASSLKPFIDSHAMAGAVTLVASKDKVLSLEAVGRADIAGQKPMRTDNFFWIASISKPITATALMMLVEEGLVNVDDPVEKYLPEFKGQMYAAERDEEHVLLKPPPRPITVRQTLSHTSGLPHLTRLEPRIDLLPLRQAAQAYALSNLEFLPDSKYGYANAGINTVARIVEVLSGLTIERFLQERIFDPLAMKETTFFPGAAQAARMPKAYKPNAAKTDLEETQIEQLTYPLTGRNRHAHPAGGLFSTATDLARFFQMILRGGEFEGRRYLSASSIRQMTTTQTHGLTVPNANADFGEGYGFGWRTWAPDPGNTDGAVVSDCGHSGAYSSNVRIYAQAGLVTIYLSQHAAYAGTEGEKILPAFRTAALGEFGES